MNIKLIKEYWQNCNEILYTVLPESVDLTKIGHDTFVFLTSCGFPLSVAPFISFPDVAKGSILSPDKIFQIEDKRLENYLMLGNNGYGDPVCIDTTENDEIVFLNHDNDFQRFFINSNIEKFAKCLIIYREFIRDVNKDDDTNWIERRFQNSQIFQLRNDLKNIDSKCLEEDAMWALEIDGLL